MTKITKACIGSLLLIWGSSAFCVTLQESFNSALNANMADRINESRLQQSIEGKKQQQGLFLPTASARGVYSKLDQGTNQRSVGLNLTHSIYNGGRDFLLVENAETSIEIARNQRQIDRLGLYLDVIENYYTYFLNLNDLKNLELLRKQSRERAEEIRKRVQIGRSRRGELLQAEAQLASVDAQSTNGEGLLKESQSVFALLTGLSRESVPEVDVSFDKTQDGLKSLDEYISMALSKEEVKNRRLEIEQLKRSVSLSKKHFLPSLDFSSNYYVHKSGGSQSYRDTDWDVGLTLSFPLYEGGVSQSLLLESLEVEREAVYALSDYEKSIKTEVTRRYEIYRRYNDQIKAYDLALEKGKRSYDEAVKDYRLGLVSNLDVLSALNIYLDNKRNAEKTRIQAMMNQKMLEAVAGVIE